MRESETKHANHPISFCVFSFNREQFLKNCIESIQKAAPFADIWVFDDHSNDPGTQAYLRQIDEEITVIQPNLKGDSKHGGLYHNMQLALEKLQDRTLLCFLQDDTQIVRPVSLEETEQIDNLFDENPDLGFVHPCFIKGIDLYRHPVKDKPGPTDFTFYRQNTKQSAGIHYSDLFITRPDHLLRKGWSFFHSEPENDDQAKNLFGPMIYMYSPFAMWLPGVPAWRGKRKTLGLKLAEKRKRSGFYPFRILSEAESIEFVNRTPKNFPIAEAFLQCTHQTPQKPWTYTPLTRQRWFKLMNNVEVYLRRKFNL